MIRGKHAFCGACAALAILFATLPPAQETGGMPEPIPPPVPQEPPPKDAPKIDSVVPESELPWGLSEDLLAAVMARAGIYQEYARRFTCDEEARHGEYGDDGEVTKERVQDYGYLLLQDPSTGAVREYRQVLKQGKLKGEVEDEEPFPPAYAWVFLFTEKNEPFFDFRLLDQRFDGFDLVYEIQFRGSLPFTDGKDIRQWEGTVLLDRFTFTPLEIAAEPAGQAERLEALYRLWAKSFNVLGFRTGKAPLGYRAWVRFGYRRDELTFPTRLRYDTYRAVGPNQVVPVQASTMTYTNYRIADVETDTIEGEVVPEP
jgi:hypothetical protein